MTPAADVAGSALAAALGYAAAWRGRTVVIKVGGSILDEGGAAREAGEDRAARAPDGGRGPPGAGTGTGAGDIALLHRAGIRTVVVHGGGPEVSRLLDRLALPARFVDGLRVTDEATMEVVEMVLSGSVNKRLVARLAAAGAPAVGLSGRDGGLLQVRLHADAERLGLVGDPDRIDPALLRHLLDTGWLPVVSPVGTDEAGRPYNVNADAAAAALAAGLEAEKLILLTDVRGIYAAGGGAGGAGGRGDAGTAAPPEPISELDAGETRRLVADGTVARGMVAKVEACLRAIEGGVPSAHIVGAEEPHGLLVELFTEEGVGTMIRPARPEAGPAATARRRGGPPAAAHEQPTDSREAPASAAAGR